MARKKQFEVEEVLDKATDLFWTKGFHATSIQNLVDHLGINRASLYGTFGGKEQLFQACLLNYTKENHQKLQDFLSQQESVKEGLKSLFMTTLLSQPKEERAKGCFVVNSTAELQPDDQVLLDFVNDNQKKVMAIFQEFLDEGKRRGEISEKADLKKINHYLFTFFTGLRVMQKTKPDPKEMEATIEIGINHLF